MTSPGDLDEKTPIQAYRLDRKVFLNLLSIVPCTISSRLCVLSKTLPRNERVTIQQTRSSIQLKNIATNQPQNQKTTMGIDQNIRSTTSALYWFNTKLVKPNFDPSTSIASHENFKRCQMVFKATHNYNNGPKLWFTLYDYPSSSQSPRYRSIKTLRYTRCNWQGQKNVFQAFPTRTRQPCQCV